MNPPSFRNNATDNINYNPTIDFDGIDDGLNLGDDYIYSSGTGTEDGMTWFAIVQADDAPSTKVAQDVFDFGSIAAKGYGMRHGNTEGNNYTAASHGGRNSGGIDHGRVTTRALSRFTVDFGNVQTGHYDGALYYSGGISLSALTGNEINENPVPIADNGPFTIGRQSKTNFLANNDGRYLDGKISELIGYNRVLSAAEVQAVESYLGIKYGITLENTNYVSTMGTVLWDATANAAYHNDVIGIGRDDAQGLLQNQSRQLNDNTRLYIGTLGISNSDNTGAFSSDNQFIMMGHNAAPSTMTAGTDFPAGLENRSERVWQVINTDFTGTFSLEIILDEAVQAVENYSLLVDTDDVFSDATIANATITAIPGGIRLENLSTSDFPVNSSRYVSLGFEATVTCTDGIQNGDETGIDCGGTDCTPCITCTDGIQNGDETGIDCGGTDCTPCVTCTDGIQNGDETGIDCGGTDCTPCVTCSDGIQNGDETGIDCGGTDCSACPTPFIVADVKALLEGPAESTLMRDDLREDGYIPLTEPYGINGEMVESSLLLTTGTTAVVDWVVIELRDANDPTTILASRAALILRNGDVVDIDGTSLVKFENMATDNYYLLLRHRNHLSVMTAQATFLSETSNGTIDFSDGNTAIYGNNERHIIDNIYYLWAGDTNRDSNINAIDRVATWNERNTSGYIDADVNMDGSCNALDRGVTWNNRNQSSGIQ